MMVREGKKGEGCCEATDVQARMSSTNAYSECPLGECLR